MTGFYMKRKPGLNRVQPFCIKVPFYFIIFYYCVGNFGTKWVKLCFHVAHSFPDSKKNSMPLFSQFWFTMPKNSYEGFLESSVMISKGIKSLQSKIRYLNYFVILDFFKIFWCNWNLCRIFWHNFDLKNEFVACFFRKYRAVYWVLFVQVLTFVRHWYYQSTCFWNFECTRNFSN